MNIICTNSHNMEIKCVSYLYTIHIHIRSSYIIQNHSQNLRKSYMVISCHNSHEKLPKLEIVKMNSN